MDESRAAEVVLADGVKKVYGGRTSAPVEALRGVSVRVAAGEAVAVVGPSGSGKSTLLTILGALESPDSGSVRVLGTDVHRMRPAEAADFRFNHVGFIFQRHHLFPGLSVLENLFMRYVGRRKPEGLREKAETLLGQVGLWDKRNSLPRELSGGEQQRACVARALLTSPSLILADEPTGNLDSANGEIVTELMLSLVRDAGATLIVVTHDRGLADKLDRTVEMRDGRIVA